VLDMILWAQVTDLREALEADHLIRLAGLMIVILFRDLWDCMNYEDAHEGERNLALAGVREREALHSKWRNQQQNKKGFSRTSKFRVSD
jgi:hypothetical protein